MTKEEKYKEAKAKLEQALSELNQLLIDMRMDMAPVYTVDDKGDAHPL